jgi:preprotein translocase subunit SecB
MAEAVPPGVFSFLTMAVTRVSFLELPLIPKELTDVESDAVHTNTEILLHTGLTEDNKQGRAALTVKVTPDPKKRPYAIEIDIEGVFEMKSGTSDQFTAFLTAGAPAILFPYVRELVHRVTSDGKYGLVRLNPMNLSKLGSKENQIEPPKS